MQLKKAEAHKTTTRRSSASASGRRHGRTAEERRRRIEEQEQNITVLKRYMKRISDFRDTKGNGTAKILNLIFKNLTIFRLSLRMLSVLQSASAVATLGCGSQRFQSNALKTSKRTHYG
jgi:hypothetical protein